MLWLKLTHLGTSKPAMPLLFPVWNGSSLGWWLSMRQSSKKRQRDARKRQQLVRQQLEAHPYCMAWIFGVCTTRATDVHELVNRSQGGSILDASIFVSLCRQCHTFVTEHPRWARFHGLHLRSWENTNECIVKARAIMGTCFDPKCDTDHLEEHHDF
jgi:hypothetical protein